MELVVWIEAGASFAPFCCLRCILWLALKPSGTQLQCWGDCVSVPFSGGHVCYVAWRLHYVNEALDLSGWTLISGRTVV